MKQITKITILTIALILSGMFAHSVMGQSVQNQDNRILIYDGRSDPRSFVVGRSIPLYSFPVKLEKDRSAGRQILAQSSQIKNVGLEILKSFEATETSVNCRMYKTDEILIDVASGSFTKPKTKQTAYLYKLYFCDDNENPKEDYSEMIGGITIFENGKMIANFVSAGLDLSHIKPSSDINRNGLSEIILATDYSRIDITEIVGDKLFTLGNVAKVHTYGGGLDGQPYFFDSKKIYAVAGRKPKFFEELYFKNGSDNWKLSKSSKKISLNSAGDWSSFFRLVK